MIRWLPLVLVACAAPDPGESASPADAPMTDGDAPTDAAPTDATPTDAAPDTGPSSPPIVTSVATPEGFTQLRQSSHYVALVIRGEQLGTTQSVTLGSLPVEIADKRDAQLALIVDVGSGLAGPVDLVVTTSGGTVTVAGAIELTPWVIAAGVPQGGHGTYQSPMSLCDPIEAYAGDTLLVQAGTHTCTAYRHVALYDGVTVVGAGRDVTFIDGVDFGFEAEYRPPGTSSSIRDLSFVGAGGGITAWDSHFTIERVDNSRYLMVAGRQASLAAADVRVDGGSGVRLELDGTAEIRNASIRNVPIGIEVQLPAWVEWAMTHVTVENTTIEHCSVGVTLGTMPSNFWDDPIIDLAMRDSSIHDAATGVDVVAADVAELYNVAITDDEATAPAKTTGIRVQHGYAVMHGGTIVGQDTGIDVYNSINGEFEPNGGGGISDGATIVGGRTGMTAGGWDTSIGCRGAIIRDQTGSSFLFTGEDTTANLHDCALSVVSGTAYVDARSGWLCSWCRVVNAPGTTLNGVGFEGQLVEGPASLAPHYSIAEGSLQF